MNTLAIIIFIIFLVFGIVGYIRGFIKSIFKIVMTAVALIVAYIFAPIVSNLIINHTNIDDSIRNEIYGMIESAIKETLVNEVESALDGAGNIVSDKLVDGVLNIELTKNQQVEFIQNLEVPEFIRTALIESNHSEMREEMGVTNFYDYIATYLARTIINAIAFLAVFLFMSLILTLTLFLLSFVVKLPVLNGLNRIGGVAFALAEALILVWIFFIGVDASMSTEFGGNIYSQIMDNKILTVLYENNVIAGFVKGLISSF